MRVVKTLAQKPRGNVLAPRPLGNLVPAFTTHRVWAGQWFLTPNYEGRLAALDRLTSDPKLSDQLRALINDQRIRYLVVPAARADMVAQELTGQVAERLPHGAFELLTLR